MAEATDVDIARSFRELLCDSVVLIEVILIEGIDSGFEAVLEEVPGVSAGERRHSNEVDGSAIVDHDLHSERRQQAA